MCARVYQRPACQCTFRVHTRTHTLTLSLSLSVCLSVSVLTAHTVRVILCPVSLRIFYSPRVHTGTDHRSECIARGYESVGCNCHPESQCEDGSEDCCGRDHSKDGKNQQHAYMHGVIHACVHTYIYAWLPCMHSYMHTCKRAYMHKCIHAYVHTCIHVCMHAYVYACMYAYIPYDTYIHVHAV